MNLNTRKVKTWAVAVAAIFCVGLASTARATCIDRPLPHGVGAPKLQHDGSPVPGFVEPDHDSIVGMWAVNFLDGTGALWDQGFELFHADGTEVNLDNGLPPSMGNVCVGVWKLVAPRTIKLRHHAWNWNPDGSRNGSFMLVMVVKLDHRGRAFTGTFTADNFDNDGHILLETRVTGHVEATRITVD
jgi:hypothetical protein